MMLNGGVVVSQIRLLVIISAADRPVRADGALQNMLDVAFSRQLCI